MKYPIAKACEFDVSGYPQLLRKVCGPLLIAALFVVFPFAASVLSQSQQKSSSIVIHDRTKDDDGGEKATENLRNEFTAALQREKPCVETMDDQDIRDAIQDERERELLEGSDPDAALKAIADRMGSSLVMTVQAMPGPGGTVIYTVSVMDMKTATTVAREMGADPKQVAQKLARSIGPYMNDNCKPHWAGTINYANIYDETKTSTDGGAAHASRKNVKRDWTENSNMQETIKATLIPPQSAAEASGNTAKARVTHRVKSVLDKRSKTTGEVLCRLRGQNSFIAVFNEEYAEVWTEIGQGTDTMAVFFSFDSDGTYSIKVTAPKGVLIGKVETTRSLSGCGPDQPGTPEVRSNGDGVLQSTSFDAEGRLDPKNPDVLSGSQTSPDGHIKITWNVRLVKPKGK